MYIEYVYRIIKKKNKQKNATLILLLYTIRYDDDLRDTQKTKNLKKMNSISKFNLFCCLNNNVYHLLN